MRLLKLCAQASTLAAALAVAGSLLPAPAQVSTETAAPKAKVHAKIKHKRKHVKKGPPPTPAKELFGAVKAPAAMPPRAIGFYAHGCLAGATALPIDGPAWQVMRLSRNRNWGHPDLIALVEQLATDAQKLDGWPGLLVGDIAQPRGGPMLSGHASHQVGLDADIWLTPMPDHRLTSKEREDLSATSMLAADGVSVDPKVWDDARVRLLKRAASYPRVERILVHPAIKKALCEVTEHDKDRAWLHKIRPYWGHYYHFHLRITCPHGSAHCEHQPPPPDDIGCGAELTRWLALVKPKPAQEHPAPLAKGKRRHVKPPLTMAQLPAECRVVLDSGGNRLPAVAKARPHPGTGTPNARSTQKAATAK
ncbi:MAG TPA: penicillin-insensitive murein endopeptidase [Hyphomicrobiaceae bacterium]|nr:penicillin-insensitive murein endopeptidase [Hyphomicrobiaceae bacterium]